MGLGYKLLLVIGNAEYLFYHPATILLFCCWFWCHFPPSQLVLGWCFPCHFTPYLLLRHTDAQKVHIMW